MTVNAKYLECSKFPTKKSFADIVKSKPVWLLQAIIFWFRLFKYVTGTAVWETLKIYFHRDSVTENLKFFILKVIILSIISNYNKLDFTKCHKWVSPFFYYNTDAMEQSKNMPKIKDQKTFSLARSKKGFVLLFWKQ